MTDHEMGEPIPTGRAAERRRRAEQRLEASRRRLAEDERRRTERNEQVAARARDAADAHAERVRLGLLGGAAVLPLAPDQREAS